MAKALSRICFFMVDEALSIVSRPVGCRAVGRNVAFPAVLARPIRPPSCHFRPANYLASLTAHTFASAKGKEHGDESRRDCKRPTAASFRRLSLRTQWPGRLPDAEPGAVARRSPARLSRRRTTAGV